MKNTMKWAKAGPSEWSHETRPVWRIHKHRSGAPVHRTIYTLTESGIPVHDFYFLREAKRYVAATVEQGR